MFVPVCFIRHIGYSSRSAVATLRALPVEHFGFYEQGTPRIQDGETHRHRRRFIDYWSHAWRL